MQPDEFYDLMESSYKPEELQALQAFMDEEEFRLDVVRAAHQLDMLADLLAEQYDPFVVAAALEVLSANWDRAVGDEDEA